MEQRELEVSKPSEKPSVLRLELPWPPTANHYTGYRVAGPKEKPFVQAYPTAKAKEFHRNVQAIVMRDRAARGWSCPLKLSIWTYPPDRRKRDTSNLFKMLEDAFTARRPSRDRRFADAVIERIMHKFVDRDAPVLAIVS